MPLPVITISGNATAYVGVSTAYSSISGQSSYSWAVSAGGTITSGLGTNVIHVKWNVPGPQTVSLNYTNSQGCTAATPVIKNITVIPVKSGAITEGDATGEPVSDQKIEVYPVPNDGQFTVTMTSAVLETYTIAVYNFLGMKVYELKDVRVTDRTERKIDIRPAAKGLYTVVFFNEEKQVTRKFLINRLNIIVR